MRRLVVVPVVLITFAAACSWTGSGGTRRGAPGSIPLVRVVPVPVDVAFSDPDPSDPALTRRLVASEVVEWAWSRSLAGPPATVPVASVLVDFAATTPSSLWFLLVRRPGGPWERHPVVTPPRPVVVALGDSLASGHHRSGATDATVCDDAGFGFPARVAAGYAARLPPAWQPSYVNVARSGFGLGAILDGQAANTCGTWVENAPVSDVVALLARHRGSWNRVVVSAGINDTNWGTVTGEVVNSQLEVSRIWRDEVSVCRAALARWTGWDDTRSATTTANVRRLAGSLAAADRGAAIAWVGYYNIAGTGSGEGVVAGRVLRGLMPAGCADEVDAALERIHATVRAGLIGTPARFVDADRVLRMKDSLIQPFYARAGTSQGWPHPSAEGARVLGDLVLAAS